MLLLFIYLSIYLLIFSQPICQMRSNVYCCGLALQAFQLHLLLLFCVIQSSNTHQKMPVYLRTYVRIYNMVLQIQPYQCIVAGFFR